MNDVRSSDARAAILETARELLLHSGYERFSIRHLAKQAACAVGTIYLYFDSKEELFQTLVEQTFQRLTQVLRSLEERHEHDDPIRVLKKALYSYVEFGLRHPQDYDLAFALPSREAERGDGIQKVFRVIDGMVGRCIREGRFRDMDRAVATQAICAAIHGITALLIQAANSAPPDRNQVINQVIRGAIDNMDTGRQIGLRAAV